MEELTLEQKYDLITRNLEEVVGGQDLKNLLQKRDPIIYWGTAPTGRIHIGYFVPLLKVADYLKAGCHVKILIADLHAFLDSMKSPLKTVEKRTEYYTVMIQEILKSLNIDISKLEFVKGSDFQLSKEYTMDVYKFHSLVNLSEAKHAGAEVVKQSDNPNMTGLLYPGLQALDEQYLGVDIQAGGKDQRKIFMYAREILPKLGYKKRIHLMNKMVSGLRTKKREENENENDENNEDNKILEKMSASDVNSKIDLLDTKNEIKKKVNKAYCLEGDANDNCLLDILNNIIFPILNHKNKDFVINRNEKYGGPIVYENFEQVFNDFETTKLHPGDLKLGIWENLNEITNPIREKFTEKSLRDLVKASY